jgi:hypothetical protein
MYQLTTDPDTVIDLDNGSYVPTTDSDYCDWLAAGNTPLPIAIPDAQQYAISNVMNGYYTEIDAGITSSASGTQYIYSIEDLTNFNASINYSLLPQTPNTTLFQVDVQDINNNQAYVPHTLIQLQQAAQDVYSGVNALNAHLQTCLVQINNGTDPAVIMAVTW